MSSTLEKHILEGIDGFKTLFRSAGFYNQIEVERVIDQSLEEIFGERPSSDKLQNHEILTVYFMRGFYAYKRKNYDKAIDFFLPIYESPCESFESMDDKARVSHLLGVIWNEKRNYSKAKSAFEISISLLKSLKKPFFEAQVHHSYGNLLTNRGLYDLAENEFENSLTLLRNVEEIPSKIEAKGMVYHSLGIMLSKIPERWSDAQEAYRVSINSLKEINDLLGQANVTISLGKLLSKRQNSLDEAEKTFKQSYNLLKEINNPYLKTKSQARIYHELGNLCGKKRVGWDEAEDAFKQSIELFDKIDDFREIFNVYYDYGKMLRNDENIISIFLSPILSLMVIWGNGIIEPFPK